MFQPIKKLLPKSLDRLNVGKQVEIAMILEEFGIAVGKIIGEKAARRVKPLYLKYKVLTVATLSSVLAQEIKLNEKIIISAINQRFEKSVIEKIRTVV